MRQKEKKKKRNTINDKLIYIKPYLKNIWKKLKIRSDKKNLSFFVT